MCIYKDPEKTIWYSSLDSQHHGHPIKFLVVQVGTSSIMASRDLDNAPPPPLPSPAHHCFRPKCAAAMHAITKAPKLPQGRHAEKEFEAGYMQAFPVSGAIAPSAVSLEPDMAPRPPTT